MKNIIPYKLFESSDYLSVMQYIKDILLELQDDGLLVEIGTSDEKNNFWGFTYINARIDGNLYDVKKYMDTILSVNDYCLSVGFYIYGIWVGSGISREDYNLLEFEKAVSNDKCNKAPIIIMIRQK